MSPYEILGIEEGADKAKVKRAYFRLLREHSPENDPEGFARIREAYERLNNPEKEMDQPSLPLPEHPYAKMFARQIERCLEEGRWELARDTAEEGWQRFSGVMYFLYYMTMAQRLCGNTGKAVKNAERLVEKEPENKWFWREMALSCLERGFTKKAYPAFVKAHELGCRDLEFLLLFTIDCREYEDYETGIKILYPLTDPSYRWDRDEMDEALESYYALAWFISELDEDMEEHALRYAGFLKKNRLYLSGEFETCVNLLAVMIDQGIRPETCRSCMQTLQEISEKESDAKIRKRNQKYMRAFRVKLINDDEKVDRSLQYLNELLVLKDGQPERFGLTDCRLCMLQERDQILEGEDYLRRTYPEFYEEAKPYLDRIRSESDAEKLRFRLLQDYRKMLEYYENGNYLNWYPEQRDAVYGKQIAASEETYVRIGKKIGRNDPCPCGSGKKYKYCCGRK